MVLVMARPQKHPKTGLYRVRKVVPAELRAVVGRRELIESLGTKNPVEARRLHPEALARFDNILAAARASFEGRTPGASFGGLTTRASPIGSRLSRDARLVNPS